MAGAGAQLIGNLLSAAFSGDQANTSPAAGGYAYTPDMALQHLNQYRQSQQSDFEPYESIDEAQANDEDIDNKTRYYDKNGKMLDDGIVKSADDLLPMKKPGFFTRAFAPEVAANANNINNQFTTSPEFADLSDRTTQGIGARKFASVMPSVVGKIPLSGVTPAIGNILTGGNNAAAGLDSTQSELSDLYAGNPESSAVTRAQQLEAARQLALNAAVKSSAERMQGIPTKMPKVQALRLGNEEAYESGYSQGGGPQAAAAADIASSGARSSVASATTELTPEETALRHSQLDAQISAQPDLKAKILADAKVGASLAEAQEKYLPSLIKTFGNQTVAQEYLSRFFPSPPAVSGIVNGDNTVSPFAKTGTPLTATGLEELFKRQALQPMIDTKQAGTIPVKLSSGATASVIPRVPVTGTGENDTTEPSYNEKDQKSVDGHPGFTVDSDGNIFEGKKLIFKKK